jgi:hypothetical protein
MGSLPTTPTSDAALASQVTTLAVLRQGPATDTVTLGGPGSIAHAAAQTRHLRVPGDRNPTNFDFDAAGQLVPKAGA